MIPNVEDEWIKWLMEKDQNDYYARKDGKLGIKLDVPLEEVAVIFKIVYSLFDEGATGEVCGFEMGYISFVFGDDNDIYDDLSHQPLMIFLTISELILGLVEYEEKRLSSKEVIAVDSSYSLKFVRNDKMTDLVINKDFTITVDTKILLKEIGSSSIEFCKVYYPSLHTSIKSDLDYAFEKISKMT